MRNRRGYYSLIQYSPDPFRAEAINAGVVLFLPGEFLQAKCTTKFKRVQSALGGPDSTLDSFKQAVRAMRNRIAHGMDQISDVDCFESFIATRANDLQLVPPRLVKVEDPEAELERLYKILVERPSEKLTKPTPPELLPPGLADTFYQLSQRHYIYDPGRVQVPVLGSRMDIPYAFQNSSVHLIKPEIFPKGKAAETKAAKLAVSGDLLQTHPDENGMERRFTVISTQEDTAEAKTVNERVAPVFEHYHIRLVRPYQAEEYATEVKKLLHIDDIQHDEE